MRHVLVVDVGNTRAKIGIYGVSGELIGLYITDVNQRLPAWLADVATHRNICGAFISVGNSETWSRELTQLVSRLTDLSEYRGFISNELRIRGMLRTAGIDRLVAAYHIAKTYGTSAYAFLCGTALTTLFVSDSGTLLGGLIMPGPSMQVKAINQNTALIRIKPRLSPVIRDRLYAQDTSTAVNSGIWAALIAFVEKSVTQLKDEVDLFIFSGGWGYLVFRHLLRAKEFKKLNLRNRLLWYPNLILDGIFSLYRELVMSR